MTGGQEQERGVTMTDAQVYEALLRHFRQAGMRAPRLHVLTLNQAERRQRLSELLTAPAPAQEGI